MARQAAVPFHFVGKADEISRQIHEIRKEAVQIRAQGGLSVAGGCRCLTKELDMIAC